jgi:CHASE2 domain-containing sensor protein
VTAQTEVKDRWLTPYSSIPMSGVEFHANAFETIAQKAFLTSAPEWWVVAFCILLCAAVGGTFAGLSGWRANAMGAGIIAAASLVPYAAFTRNVVFPFSPGFSNAWLAMVTAAACEHLYVRRRMGKTGRTGPLPACRQFVTHDAHA